jgi:glyoxylase I family protein
VFPEVAAYDGGVKIEHTAYQVADPVALARWYVDHLGLTVKRAQSAAPFGHFLSDDGDTVMLEFYANPRVNVPDYRAMDPLLLHIAFAADDVPATRARLISAGATAEGDVTHTEAGDVMAMLRDPWGLAVQLVRRRTPMIG